MDDWLRAVLTEIFGDKVIVAIGIRGAAVGELEMDEAQYDGLTLLRLLERYSGDPASVH